MNAIINEAVKTLSSDGLVAIPTETVYGLAASIQSEVALEKIFKTKGRPYFDPLIVHVGNLKQVEIVAEHFPKAARILAEKFWPGPLTFVVKKSSQVSHLICAGLDTVAVRMPNHPVALQLINEIDIPLAAPSANKFGKTSPTKAKHVSDEFQSDEVLILDGGDCEVGIESTIVMVEEINHEVQVKLLRKGMISLEQIVDVLSTHYASISVSEALEHIVAPGQLKHHYMPEIPLALIKEGDDIDRFTGLIKKQIGKKVDEPLNTLELKMSDNELLAARELYALLKDASTKKEVDLLYMKLGKHFSEKRFEPILDRLTKASSFLFV